MEVSVSFGFFSGVAEVRLYDYNGSLIGVSVSFGFFS